jgi:hypothetical protein
MKRGVFGQKKGHGEKVPYCAVKPILPSSNTPTHPTPKVQQQCPTLFAKDPRLIFSFTLAEMNWHTYRAYPYTLNSHELQQHHKNTGRFCGVFFSPIVCVTWAYAIRL